MKFQATHTITRNGKVIIKKGDILTQSQVDKKRVKNYVVSLMRNTYTTEDYNLMVKVYLENDTSTITGMVDKFIEMNPTTTLSRSGLQMYFSIISGCDTNNPHVGLDNPSKELMSILKNTDITRF